MEIARAAAQNPPLSNFAICSAISHMQNMSALDAAYAESVVAGIVNTQPAAAPRWPAWPAGSCVSTTVAWQSSLTSDSNGSPWCRSTSIPLRIHQAEMLVDNSQRHEKVLLLTGKAPRL